MFVHQFAELSVSPASSAVAPPIAEVLHEMQVAQHLGVVLCRVRVLWSFKIPPALRENPVKNSSRLSSRSNIVSMLMAEGAATTVSSRLNVKHVMPP